MNSKWLWFSMLCFAGCASSATSVTSTSPGQNQSKQESQAVMAQKESPSVVKIKIETSMGDIQAELYPKEAPKTVENFVTLAKKGFYDGLIFHRVIPGFMVQTGDPTGTGMGGPGYQFANENSELRYDRPGRFGMANSGPDTNGSQFFITEEAQPHLDGGYTIFGQVTEGNDVVKSIGHTERDGRDKPLTNVVMKKVTVIEG